MVVKLSFTARRFLSGPNRHILRLVAILRLFANLGDLLPCELLLPLLPAMLSPAHRCLSFVNQSGYSRLPEVSSLEELLLLNRGLQLEFLGQIAESFLEALTLKFQEANLSSELTTAQKTVRKAVDKARGQRRLERRLKPIVNQEAAAHQRKAQNKKKVLAKKRNMEEHIKRTKGARGGLKAKPTKTLV
mmetsp:Transcript_22413/g.47768  ORF Transcript_22413/g.47768 Transcript_22413/m.47768 type:complete len:189 (+) Transcript_22413:876-1442(+)